TGEGAAEQPLALAKAVEVRSVEKVDAGVERRGERVERLRLISRPVRHRAVLVAADAPGAEADLRNGEARAPQLPQAHPSSGPPARVPRRRCRTDRRPSCCRTR